MIHCALGSPTNYLDHASSKSVASFLHPWQHALPTQFPNNPSILEDDYGVGAIFTFTVIF